jgi:hypothetical protein
MRLCCVAFQFTFRCEIVGLLSIPVCVQIVIGSFAKWKCLSLLKD